jgi:hypothetical protein
MRKALRHSWMTAFCKAVGTTYDAPMVCHWSDRNGKMRVEVVGSDKRSVNFGIQTSECFPRYVFRGKRHDESQLRFGFERSPMPRCNVSRAPKTHHPQCCATNGMSNIQLYDTRRSLQNARLPCHHMIPMTQPSHAFISTTHSLSRQTLTPVHSASSHSPSCVLFSSHCRRHSRLHRPQFQLICFCLRPQALQSPHGMRDLQIP